MIVLKGGEKRTFWLFLKRIVNPRTCRTNRGEIMKKGIFFSLIAGLVMIFGTCAWAHKAKKGQGTLPAPEYLNCNIFGLNIEEPGEAPLGELVEEPTEESDGSLCLEWGMVEGAKKYAIEIEVLVDIDDDGFEDMVVELSFNTADRTDGLPMDDPTFCVPLSELVYEYDFDADGIIDLYEQGIPLTGTASVKVKALKPGKGNGRQNNVFSPLCTLDLTSPSNTTPVIPY
jgi:hypothetical protein